MNEGQLPTVSSEQVDDRFVRESCRPQIPHGPTQCEPIPTAANPRETGRVGASFREAR